MAFHFDEVHTYEGQHLVCQEKSVPRALGVGPQKVNHTSYIQGNTQIGKVDAFSSANATLMVGREDTIGTDRSVYVNGNQYINGDSGTSNALYVTGGGSVDSLYVDGDVYVTGRVDCGNKGRLASRFSSADARPKPFDLKHPSREGYRLRYACIEGPEVGVYVRGRVKDEKVIDLPKYWKDLVHEDSIAVQLQPIVHQDIIVEKWDDEKIYLQPKEEVSINCFIMSMLNVKTSTLSSLSMKARPVMIIQIPTIILFQMMREITRSQLRNGTNTKLSEKTDLY